MKYYQIFTTLAIVIIIIEIVGCSVAGKSVQIPASWPLSTEMLPPDATYFSVGEIENIQSDDGSYIEQSEDGAQFRVWTVAFQTNYTWMEVKTHFLASLDHSYNEYSSIENHAYVVKLNDINMIISLLHYNDDIFYYTVRELIDPELNS